ncbi:hypothetical protein QE152_g25493 [Popillia japonica]|uniref:Uncharacterized protein n=1 Tax=Popillia japonica TaxID=7064 RepID=A0AAW1K2I5_POPJA
MSDAEKYTDENNRTKWKARKENKVRKEGGIKTAKIRGEAHINHAGKEVPARVTARDYRCTRLKCFENMSQIARQNLVLTFNSVLTKNEPGNFLSGLTSFHAPICRRRVRLSDSEAQLMGVHRDRHGTHHRPNKIPQEVEKLIVQHIHSFKGRQSHYSRRKNPYRLYLPETVSVKKMCKMFLEKYRINVTYKSY